MKHLITHIGGTRSTEWFASCGHHLCLSMANQGPASSYRRSNKLSAWKLGEKSGSGYPTFGLGPQGVYSDGSALSLRMSSGSMPEVLRFLVQTGFPLTPWLQTSRTVAPPVTDDNIFTICSSLKQDFLILTPF